MVRNKYPEKTVEKILTVAQSLFFEKGYDHTTMQDIVDQGLSKGVIYYHFKSKREIFDRIMSKIDTTQQNLSDIKKDNSLNGLQKIQHLLRATLSNHQKIELMCSAKSLFSEPKIFGEIYLVNMRYQVPMIEELITIGLLDGSIQTNFPGELAELVIEFFSIWLGLQVYYIDEITFTRKLAFYQQLFSNQGLDLLNDELINKAGIFYKKIEDF